MGQVTVQSLGRDLGSQFGSDGATLADSRKWQTTSQQIRELQQSPSFKNDDPDTLRSLQGHTGIRADSLTEYQSVFENLVQLVQGIFSGDVQGLVNFLRSNSDNPAVANRNFLEFSRSGDGMAMMQNFARENEARTPIIQRELDAARAAGVNTSGVAVSGGQAVVLDDQIRQNAPTRTPRPARQDDMRPMAVPGTMGAGPHTRAPGDSGQRRAPGGYATGEDNSIAGFIEEWGTIDSQALGALAGTVQLKMANGYQPTAEDQAAVRELQVRFQNSGTAQDVRHTWQMGGAVGNPPFARDAQGRVIGGNRDAVRTAMDNPGPPIRIPGRPPTNITTGPVPQSPAFQRAASGDRINVLISDFEQNPNGYGLTRLRDEIKQLRLSGYQPTPQDQRGVLRFQSNTQLAGNEGAIRISAEIGENIRGERFARFRGDAGELVGGDRAAVQNVYRSMGEMPQSSGVPIVQRQRPSRAQARIDNDENWDVQRRSGRDHRQDPVIRGGHGSRTGRPGTPDFNPQVGQGQGGLGDAFSGVTKMLGGVIGGIGRVNLNIGNIRTRLDPDRGFTVSNPDFGSIGYDPDRGLNTRGLRLGGRDDTVSFSGSRGVTFNLDR